ncbi:unnamed protein product [Urochloa decumbens]|uniref:Uncharacterized protein n=1 Tax=Urochloa decumbens TaxID=240449 RepID=A0ABC9A616_9POAL
MRKKSGSGGCLGAPMRALSRACGSACDLYVRGMSGCARRVPSGSSAGVVGRGFGGAGAASLRMRVSSDGADDLVRAAAKRYNQRRVAAEPAEDGGADYDAAANKKASAAGRQRRVAAEPQAEAVGYSYYYNGAAGKKGGGVGAALVVSAAAPEIWAPATKKGGAAAMGTIAEDEPCEFGPDGACDVVSSTKPPRRAAFGAVTAAGGGGVFAR